VILEAKDLPDSFRKNVAGAFAQGSDWLDALPQLLADCERRLQIATGPPFKLSYNYVAPALNSAGEEVVLKLGVPNPELTSEIRALQHYAGRGSVQLLDFDEARGVLLLERLTPGKTLLSVSSDEEATRIAARLMRKLWRPLPSHHSFPTVEVWARGLKRTGPLPRRLVQMAETLFRELIASSGPPVLLHGDLHHFNILSAQRTPWVAIDPKGVAGEPAYEPGALLRNPHRETCTDIEVQRRRVMVLCEELGLDRQRMVGWAMAQAVLSAWWSYEEAGSWEPACAIAEVLSKLI
jgi:streptomycin 6-kinase